MIKTQSDSELMVKTYKDRAKVYQTDVKRFIVAYYAGPILVNLLLDDDGLEAAVNRLRRKNKLIVEFNWMADR